MTLRHRQISPKREKISKTVCSMTKDFSHKNPSPKSIKWTSSHCLVIQDSSMLAKKAECCNALANNGNTHHLHGRIVFLEWPKRKMRGSSTKFPAISRKSQRSTLTENSRTNTYDGQCLLTLCSGTLLATATISA